MLAAIIGVGIFFISFTLGGSRGYMVGLKSGYVQGMKDTYFILSKMSEGFTQQEAEALMLKEPLQK